MADVEVSYKGSTIATMNASGTKTLETSGKYCEDDITVQYTKSGGGSPALQSKTSKSTGVEQIVTPDSGYDGLSSVTITPVLSGVIRPDAELVKTYTYNKLLVTDESVTLPAYNSSSQTTVKATEALSETYTCDFDNYNYYILERFATIPIYSSSSTAKGRQDYAIGVAACELVDIPENAFESQSGGKKYASPIRAFPVGSMYRELYWSGTSAVSVYSGSSYGMQQIAAAPTLSGSVITVKSPDIKVRGHTSYLSSTYYGYITDVRAQYVIEIYRAPKLNNGVNGWGLFTEINRTLNRLYSNNWTL